MHYLILFRFTSKNEPLAQGVPPEQASGAALTVSSCFGGGGNLKKGGFDGSDKGISKKSF
jgi:hypothetical protein